MQPQLPPSRAKTALVFVLILLPLVLTIVVKYLPALTGHPKIHAISIVPPRLYAPAQYDYLMDDVPKRLLDELAGIEGIQFRPSPAASESQVGDDLEKVAKKVGADALIVPSVTIDAGIIQLNVQIIDPNTKRILYNTPFQSPLGRYPDMMRAAGAALKRALQQ